jgi:hypothetical protein
MYSVEEVAGVLGSVANPKPYGWTLVGRGTEDLI